MTHLIVQVIFWSIISLLAYVYAGYPILVFIKSKLFPRPVKRGSIEPDVSILITAYNEDAAIRQKIENTLAIDYPAEKLEIMVASDGSTDATDEIVREFGDRGVRLFRQEGRSGKTITQNNAVKECRGEIILFSDATTEYPSDVLRRILPNFADETVGCVAGRLIYVDEADTNVGSGAKSYWGYETFLKIAESRSCSLIGASGAMYAVRRSGYREMYAEACSDFLIATILYRQGLRTIFEPDAVCTEITNTETENEMRMRVRVIAQTFTDLWRNPDILDPFRHGFFAVQMISHKVLRYAVPLLLMALFAANALLVRNNTFYDVTMVLQALFYLAAAGGWLLEKAGIRLRILFLPLYFVIANLASVIAILRFLSGERISTWEPIRASDRA
ncbi:MAG: glycosyltransferase family 2 protein [Acidobacteria bacterium]|nr:glycosyltransferase family 2 protein [Acidobacteriota bacterium]MCW5948549.1 glycosyltransferase family 2 protein [Pyrinomonadaceae bacterium]